MKSFTNQRFRELFAELPAQVQRHAREAYREFRENPSYPGLHFKQIFSDPSICSARVGIGYRAVCVREGDRVIWFWIGSHAAYDRLLASI